MITAAVFDNAQLVACITATHKLLVVLQEGHETVYFRTVYECVHGG